MKIHENVFKSSRWTSETAERDGIEWRMDFRDGQLVQVLLRPVGTTQWRRPMEYLELRVASSTGKERD